MRESRIKTLVLFRAYTKWLSYYDDWLDSFLAAPDFEVTSLNICNADARRRLRRLIKEAELTVLLHSTNADTITYLEPLSTVLQDRVGSLVCFVGDEFNNPGSPISAKRRVFGAIEPDVIATQLLVEAGEYLFGDLVRLKVVSLPHGLNPDVFQPRNRQRDRPIDIGVRAGKYPPHIGDGDRNYLHDYFSSHAFKSAPNVDISTRRLVRKDWAAFLNRCKGTVGCEAGSWYLERDDATVEAIRAYTARQFKPKGLMIPIDSRLQRLGHKLPWAIRASLRRLMRRGPLQHETAVNDTLPFNEVFERFFAGKSRCPVYSKCISSRHFDAIGTGTVQVLLSGRYNDILIPDRHYIALSPDYSDITDVMERFSDVSYREAIANEARQHVLAEHTYARRIAALRVAIEAPRGVPAESGIRQQSQPESPV